MGKNITNFFKSYRFVRRITQRKMAEQIGIKQPYLARIENGLESFPISACKSLYEICSRDEKVSLLRCIQDDVKEMLD